MRFLLALLSLFALTLVPTVAAPAFASPTHASECGGHQSKPNPAMSDCVAKCCTANPAATPAELVRVAAPIVAPRPSYRAEQLAARQSPPLPFEPPPPRTA
ncbi:MAG: hypothetical protein ABIQ98_04265 [Sphingomicrobium sp.]